MSSIDNRIVSMKFDNAQFERGVSTTISSMDKLKQSLKFDESKKHIQNLGNSIASFNVGGMEGSVTKVSNAFLAMSTIGITALSNITSKAISAGTQLVKSLTIDPVTSGLHEYETNLGSIQTIMSNTAAEGTKLEDVNAALDELNRYSDKTIYNFSEMARNIGTFTAAGVKLDPSVAAIKGIANLAAVSGSNAEQASTAMYQLSQALAAGKVGLQDWNSVVNAGMGGKVFQEALKRTARNHGIAVDAIIKKNGSFRESLKAGWIDESVLTDTLAQLTGDLTDEQLRAQGYTAQQIKDIQALAKNAQDAATKVKTMSQLIDTLKETAGSGWADTWEIIFGDFEEAKDLWTGLNNVIGGWITRSAEARNKVLGDWKKLGGRTHLIEAIKNIFEALGNVLKPIGKAFRELFPRTTGQQLYDMTLAFENFTERLVINEDVMDKLTRTFRGIFAIFSVLRQLGHGVIKVFLSIFDALAGPGGDAGEGFLSITAKIGDFLSSIEQLITQSQAIQKFFGAIGWAIAGVITLVWDLARTLAGLFTGGDTPFFDTLSSNFSNLAPILQGIKDKISSIVQSIKDLFSRFRLPTDLFGVKPAVDSTTTSLAALHTQVEESTSIFDGWGDAISRAGDALLAAFDWVKEAMSHIFEGTTLQDWLSLINTAYVISFVRSLGKILKPLSNIADSFDESMQMLPKTLGAFNGALKSMSMDLKASAIMKIAAAILFLALAIWILSFVDPGEVAIGLAALAGILGILIVAVKQFSKGLSNRTVARLAVLSFALMGLAVAITMFAGAIALLGNMEPATLIKGIGAIAAILAVMAVTVKVFDKAGGPKKLAGIAGALMLMAIALDMLAASIFLYAKMDLGTLWSGLYKVAAVLAVIAAFMWVVSGLNMKGSLVGLVAAAIAMNILAGALKQLGDIGLWQLAKGLVAMGVALAIIATALWVMETTLPGAAALFVAVLALKLLVPVVERLGNMSWGVILKGIAGLVLVMAALAIGSLLLAPAVPILLMFAGAIGLLGAAFFLAGAGAFLFATAMGILAVVGVAGISVLISAIIAFIGLLPLIAEQIGLAVVAWAKVIGEKAPELVKALFKLIMALIDELKRNAPTFYRTMIDLLIELLRAIRDKMPEIAEEALLLVEEFVDTFGSRESIRRLAEAGADLVINFLNGLADAIDRKNQELIDAGKNIGTAVVKGIGKGLMNLTPLGGAVSWLVDRIKGQAETELEIESPSKVFMRIGKMIPAGLGVGIVKSTQVAVDATEKMGDATVLQMKDTMSRIADVVDTDMDLDPVIAPVLDLTAFQKTATKMDKMLQTTPLTTNLALDQASTIAAKSRPVEEETPISKATEPTIKFEQNNYSPKALSPAEVYRNTRNQLLYAKELMAG